MITLIDMNVFNFQTFQIGGDEPLANHVERMYSHVLWALSNLALAQSQYDYGCLLEKDLYFKIVQLAELSIDPLDESKK